MASSRIDRRSFLKAAGVCIALPVMESLPRASWAGGSDGRRPGGWSASATNSACIPAPSGRRRPGRITRRRRCSKPLEPFRRDFTVFSHLDHGLKGGHYAIHAFLTGVKAVEAKGMADGGISLDQRAAEFVGSQARFPSLAIGSEGGLSGGCQMSWTRSGTRIPPIPGPRELFRLLFVDEAPDERRKAADRVAPGRIDPRRRARRRPVAEPPPEQARQPQAGRVPGLGARRGDEAVAGQEMAGHPQAHGPAPRSRRTRGWSATCRCSTT